uniref:Leucine-rich repeat-containing N-terminal plant-type domain-containing protein n=1 Tax=Fagus sylvatica TaxID=28930 RepID=A0A2N9FIW3_FAGSY
MASFSLAVAVVRSNNITTDQSALLALKAHITDDPYNFLTSNWSTSTSVCNWIGISCGAKHQRVTALNLTHMGLRGTIPPHVGNLSFLTHLSFRNNSFHGSLPNQLASLRRLEVVSFGMNNFSGELPSWLGFFPKLQVFPTLPQSISSTHYWCSVTETLRRRSSSSIPVVISSGDKTLEAASPLESKEESNNGSLVNFKRRDQSKSCGMIPRSLGNCTSLERIHLDDNYLTGELPLEIGNLQNLMEITLANNSLTGTIPNAIFNISTIEVISLYLNYFSGQLPLSIGHWLPNLKELYLWENELQGIIPNSISNASKLTQLDLGANYFSGSIPNTLGNLRHLETLNLGNNYLTREASILELSFLSSLTNCKNLKTIVLAYNPLNGTLPNSIGNLSTSLEEFLAFNCNIKGIIPVGIGNLSNMMALHLEDNELAGPIPSTVGGMRNLRGLFLQHNNLTGRIPPMICKVNSLQVLHLSNNDLIGQIPQCLGNFSSSLLILNMRSNSFQGILPETFIKGSSLRTLDVSLNQIEGKIPRSLVKCRLLEVLNLGNNNMNDIFPFWLESLPELKILILRANGFQGPIWDSHTNFGFSKLHVIDLSHNNFSGRLPSEYFKTWNAMLMVHGKINSKPEYMHTGYYEDSITVMNKGLEMELVKILTIFIAIDLSNNRFCGEIPNTMGNLKELIVLNLSRNSFTGPIPSSFGNLTELQSLDLSQNKFLGEIPQQLISLTFLEYLNLSQNQLLGPIPQGGQFWTFESSSFEGNLGLCGSPLLKKCENNETLTSISSHESSFGEEFNWKVVVIGYACGLVIGLLIGHVVISRRLDWFMRTFRVNLHW